MTVRREFHKGSDPTFAEVMASDDRNRPELVWAAYCDAFEEVS